METNETPQTATVNNNGENETVEKPCYKLTDEEFLAVLEENNGLYAQTARAIQRKYGIPFTRQSVRERAITYSNEKFNIQESVIEEAKGTIYEAVKQNENLKLKYKAASFLLNKLKSRDIFNQ